MQVHDDEEANIEAWKNNSLPNKETPQEKKEVKSDESFAKR